MRSCRRFAKGASGGDSRAAAFDCSICNLWVLGENEFGLTLSNKPTSVIPIDPPDQLDPERPAIADFTEPCAEPRSES
jgi:hypothetical protein